MSFHLRRAVAADAKPCGQVIYAAFKDVDEHHGFTTLFTLPEHATKVARISIGLTSTHGIVEDSQHQRPPCPSACAPVPRPSGPQSRTLQPRWSRRHSGFRPPPIP